MKISRPTEKEYDITSYQHRYIQAVTTADGIEALKKNASVLESFFKDLTQDKLHYRYAEGKWSPIEILGHIIDTERILCYRALCMARNEKKSLLGFDEEAYMEATNFEKKSLSSLLLQYKTQRKSTLLLFKSFTKRELARMGQANNLPTNARVLAWFIVGHELHHINIIKERYL